jgi:hypothetical protein
MDEDGYPTDEELAAIESWEVVDIMGLVEYVMDLWHWSDYATLTHDVDKCLLELHTGGWSGNESIIDTLMGTMFWGACWEKSMRGGHYWFDIPKWARKKHSQSAM